MQIKVCGMRDPENISDLYKTVNPDIVGLIFYPKSKRFVSNLVIPNGLKNKAFAGVFVNASFDDIVEKVKSYPISYIQLHGNESPEYITSLKEILEINNCLKGLKFFKAFGVDSEFVFDEIKKYEPYIDYFLFDTKGKSYGGNGVTFDWELLRNYNLSKPFLLSGGIGEEHLSSLKSFISENNLPVWGIDINSRFETKPGFKDIPKIYKFTETFRDSLI